MYEVNCAYLVGAEAECTVMVSGETANRDLSARPAGGGARGVWRRTHDPQTTRESSGGGRFGTLRSSLGSQALRDVGACPRAAGGILATEK